MMPIKILLIATSHSQMGESDRKTGLWLEELAVPYYIFQDAGLVITLASPKGGEVPLDPKSESIIASTSTIKRFQKDPDGVYCLNHSTALSELKAEDFDLVFLLGGHGPMWDFLHDEQLKKLLEGFDRQNKLIGSVCHGAAALLQLESISGEPFVKGRQITAFSNSEEQVWGLTKMVPFMLETDLSALGAIYSKSHNFVSHIVVDGNLITGQNPASSKEVAKKLLLCIKESSKRSEAALRLT
jgi:putative intracellular protease/amidase